MDPNVTPYFSYQEMSVNDIENLQFKYYHAIDKIGQLCHELAVSEGSVININNRLVDANRKLAQVHNELAIQKCDNNNLKKAYKNAPVNRRVEVLIKSELLKTQKELKQTQDENQRLRKEMNQLYDQMSAIKCANTLTQLNND